MKFLANEYDIIYKSDSPDDTYIFSPSICVLPSGRYVASMDIGGAGSARHADRANMIQRGSNDFLGKILISDDKGKTWKETGIGNFCHARVFFAGGRTYVLGNASELIIYCSEDDGETWDNGHILIKDRCFKDTGNVLIEDEYVTLCMMERICKEGQFNEGWPVFNMAPFVMRARLDADLTKPENWCFSETEGVRFRDIIDEDSLDDYGVPFYNTVYEKHRHPEKFEGIEGIHSNYCVLEKRTFNPEEYVGKIGIHFDNPSGWLESNTVKITDPTHYWYDASGNTYHIFLRAHTSGTGYCMLMKAVVLNENGREKIILTCETNPSGRRVLYLPMPGGQMKFHITWDEKTKLYWLISTQAVDSMTRVDHLPKYRYNIPCDERQRLQLSFSKNMVDWCFAGMVTAGETVLESRHYAAMDIDGEDLVIISRSGSPKAQSPHNTDMATLHRVENFRDLIY